MITPSTRERVFHEQKGKCARCWRTFQSHEDLHAHHAVYTKDKRIKELDMAENIVLVCPKCHSDHGYLSSWFARCQAWSEKIDLGYDMVAWEKSLPMLIHDEFIYFEKEEKNNAKR